MNSYSEVNKTKKTWPRKACVQCQSYSCGDLDVLHISPEWYNPNKSTSPSQSHRHWFLKSTYPANSAFIGDQNLLTLGNIQFGQGLNDGIFIRAWKEPMKTSQAACTRIRGLPWPCSGCAFGHTALHTSVHNLGFICARVPQPSITTAQDRENKSLTNDAFMAKTWISSGVQIAQFPPVPWSEVMQMAELLLQKTTSKPFPTARAKKKRSLTVEGDNLPNPFMAFLSACASCSALKVETPLTVA